MADEREDEIILTVDIDEGAVEKRSIALREAIARLRDEKKKLDKEYKDGVITANEYAKSQQAIEKQLGSAQTKLRENTKTLSDFAKQNESAAGSINQMRAQVSLLYADYAALSREERNNAEIGGVLKKQLKELNDELKDQEGAVGDNRRSVGSYSEAIEGAISKNTNFVSTLGSIREKLGEAQGLIKGQISDYKNLTAGMNGAQKASVGLGIGLKAIGIGILLQAIAAVISYLSKFDDGIDKVEQATEALSAGFDALVRTLAPLGELLVNTFLHPIDAVQKFGAALLHPIDTFNKIKNGATDLADNISDNFSRAAKAGVEYRKTIQDIEGQYEDGLISQEAQVKRQVALALIATKDRSKSHAERMRQLDQAGKAEQNLANITLDIEKRKLDALVKRQKAIGALQGDDKKAYQEQLAAYINAQAATEQVQQQIANRRSALVEQDLADQKQAAATAQEIAKKAADERVALAENQLLLARKNGKDTLAFEEEVIRKRLASEIIGLKKSSEQRKLLIAKANAEIYELNVKHAADLALLDSETTLNRIDAQLALVRKGSKDELEIQKKALAERLVAEKSALVEAARLQPQTEANKRALNAKLRLLDAKFNAETEQLDDAFAKAELDRKADLDNKRLQTEIDLGNQTFDIQVDNQRKQIIQEEKHALALLQLEEDTAKARGQLTEQLANELLVKRNAIQARSIAAQKQLDQEVIQQAKASAVALAEAQVAATEEGSKKRLDAQRKLLKAMYDAEIANKKLTEAEKEKITAQYQAADKKAKADYSKELSQQIIDTVSLATSTLSTAYEAQTQALLSNLDKQQQAALESAGANADLRARIEEQYQKKREKLEKEAAEKKRRIASIENLIATAQAATAALTLFAKNPILGAITEALILAKAIQNQSLIDSQQFALGGTYISDGKGAVIKGPGTAKSDSINSKLSNGESVLTAKATTMFYNELSAMNVAGGGRAFPGANGTETPKLSKYADGGVQSVNSNIVGDLITALKAANFVVAVTDIHRVEDDMTYASARGNT